MGVHIADVANYVQENSALDWEARERGTSVYLADRVIPMLPRTLSNGICSLNQGEDRLALSCIMTIDEKGKIIGHRLAETVICVNRRLSYTGVQKVLDGDETERSAYPELVPMLLEMERYRSCSVKDAESGAPLILIFRRRRWFWTKKGMCWIFVLMRGIRPRGSSRILCWRPTRL